MTANPRSSVHSATWGLAGTGCRALSFLVAGILVARRLGPTGRGTYGLVLTGSGLAASLVLSTLTPIAATLARRGGMSSSGILRAILPKASLRTATACIVTVFFTELATDGDAHQLAVYAGLIVAPQVYAGLVSQQLSLFDRVKDASIANLLLASVYATLIVLFWQTNRLSLALALAAFGAALTVAAVVLRRAVSATGPSDAAANGGRVSSPWKIQLSAAALILIWRLDVYVVALRGDLAVLGVYAVAVSVGEAMSVIFTGVRASILPRLRPFDDALAPVGLLARLNLLAVASACAVAGLVYLTGPELFEQVFGSQFGEAWRPTLFLLPGVAAYSVVLNLIESLQLSKSSTVLLNWFCAALLLNVLFDWYTVPRWGAEGAALGSSVAYAISAFGALRHASTVSKAPLSTLLRPNLRSDA